MNEYEDEEDEQGLEQTGTIVEIHEDGEGITLEDGSVWDVPNPGDSARVALWRVGQRVSVVAREDDVEDVSDHIHVEYTVGEVTITNLDTRDAETVRVVSRD